jgi:hypothetical protein
VRGRAFITALLLAAFSVAAAPQESLEGRPGYFPLDGLDVLAKDHLKVEINLHGALLKLVAGATREDEPEFSQLIAGLEAVRVRVASVADLDFDRAREDVRRAARRLEERGWQTIVRAREEGEDFYLYLRQEDGEVVGLAVLTLEEGGDAAAVNIIGKIDMTQIAELGRTFKIPHLDEAQKRSEESADEPRDR